MSPKTNIFKTNIFLALTSHDAIRSALITELEDGNDPKLADYRLVRDICDAEILITDTPTIDFDFEKLPENVRYLQLVDCGSGAPHQTGENLTVANASSFLAEPAATQAIEQWQELRNPDGPSGNIHSSPFFAEKGGTKGGSKQPQQTPPTIAGIIGFGTLGYEIAKQLNQLDAKIWINDIRTPRQQSFQKLGARRSTLDMLLSTCDVVFLAVHHGPTSNPLLTHRELSLMNVGATIFNLSGPKVIDRYAITTLNSTEARSIEYCEIAPDNRTPSANDHPKKITRLILDNLRARTSGRPPRSIVEHVTYPSAGDPAFWASRMHPRQTPV